MTGTPLTQIQILTGIHVTSPVANVHAHVIARGTDPVTATTTVTVTRIVNVTAPDPPAGTLEISQKPDIDKKDLICMYACIYL